MKTNAIIRIVIWSVVILLLLCILLAGLGAGPLLRWNPSSSGATEATIVYTQPEADTVTLTKPLKVYNTPNTDDGKPFTTLESGQDIRITRQETVGAAEWGFIDSPVSGWILMKDLQKAAPAATEPKTPSTKPAAATEPDAAKPGPAADKDAISVSSGQVSPISIEWAAGSIQILPGDGDSIQFWEEGKKNAQSMDWTHKGQKLTISSQKGKLSQGIGLKKTHSKNLTILVPKDWVCQELEVDAASATLAVQDLTIQEVDIDAASGKCSFSGCAVGSMEVDTMSGDISFSGTLNTLECDAASASFVGIFTNVPRSIEMDSASGNLKLTLPAEAGFSAKVSGLSSKFSSDFETTSQNGRYVHGDGYCRIDMEAASGSLTIRKG